MATLRILSDKPKVPQVFGGVLYDPCQRARVPKEA